MEYGIPEETVDSHIIGMFSLVTDCSDETITIIWPDWDKFPVALLNFPKKNKLETGLMLATFPAVEHVCGYEIYDYFGYPQVYTDCGNSQATEISLDISVT
jgi:hypothetical protein